MTYKQAFETITAAMGGWADYGASTTPLAEAIEYHSERHGDNIPQDVVDGLMARFAPHHGEYRIVERAGGAA